MPFSKTIIRLVALVALLGTASSCVSNGTTTVGNPTGSTKVTFGALASGVSRIQVPIGVFGTTANLSSSSIEVIKNGSNAGSINPAQSFNTTSNAVVFNISALTASDVVSIIVATDTSTRSVYASTVGSATREREAINCASTTNAAIQLVCGVCERITSCNEELTMSSCIAGIISDDQVQLDDEFGVPVLENSISMEAVVEGVESSTYVASTTYLDQCLNDLNALSCSEVDLGYSSADPENFDNVENFIPGEDETSCGLVFGGELHSSIRLLETGESLLSLDLGTAPQWNRRPLSATEVANLLRTDMDIESLYFKKEDLSSLNMAYDTTSLPINTDSGAISCGLKLRGASLALNHVHYRSQTRSYSVNDNLLTEWACLSERDQGALTSYLGDAVSGSSQTRFQELDQFSGGGLYYVGDRFRVYSKMKQSLTFSLNPEMAISFNGQEMIIRGAYTNEISPIFPQGTEPLGGRSIMTDSPIRRGVYSISGNTLTWRARNDDNVIEEVRFNLFIDQNTSQLVLELPTGNPRSKLGALFAKEFAIIFRIL